jgi:hypothetical protein
MAHRCRAEGQAGIDDELPDGSLAGLRSRGVAADLGHGVRDAQQGRAVVVDAADGLRLSLIVSPA